MNPARTTVPFFDLLLADFSGGFPPQYWQVSKVKGVECHEEASESVCSSLGAELCLPLRQAPGVCLHVLICTLIDAARQESCLEVKSMDSGVSLQDLNPALLFTSSVTLNKSLHTVPQFLHLYNGDDNSTSLKRLSCRSNALIHHTCSEQ